MFAALAVGCSSPVALQTSEYDDVYYSSKDKTVIQERVVASASTEISENEVQTEDNAVPNPEYSEKNSGTGYSSRDYNNTDDYYSDDYLYSSRRYAPYRSGLSYYDLAYSDYWYNRSPYLYGRSTFYDPFYAPYSYYDPFYSPYYDYGFRYPRIYTGLTVVIGRPYYGGFYGGHPYYGGYGGFNGGWYGGGFNRYYANSGWYRNDTNSAAKVQYGPRRDRSVVPDGNAGTNTGARPRGDAGRVVPGGGGGVVAPGDNRGARPANADVRSTRSRAAGNAGTAPDVNNAGRDISPEMARPTDSPERATRVGRQSRNVENVIGNDAERTTVQPGERPSRRARIETNDYNLPDQPARSMEERPAVRPRSERNTERYTPETTQPQRREYEPQRTERQERVRETYRPEPTYQAPRRERSYEAPRYEAPRTYDQPSSRPSSGGSSSGSDGGSSSGGRGGRPRN